MATWIKLENFRCPSCKTEGGKDWVCAVDNEDVFLNEDGVMECADGTHTGLVIEWKWNCGSSAHCGKFLAAEYEGFIFAMSQAVQLTDRAGSNWVATLVKNIGRQYGQ